MPLISFPFKNTAVVRGNVFPMTHDFQGDSVMCFTFMPVIILSGVLSLDAPLWKKYQRRCTLGEPQEGEKCGKESSEENQLADIDARLPYDDWCRAILSTGSIWVSPPQCAQARPHDPSAITRSRGKCIACQSDRGILHPTHPYEN